MTFPVIMRFVPRVFSSARGGAKADFDAMEQVDDGLNDSGNWPARKRLRTSHAVRFEFIDCVLI